MILNDNIKKNIKEYLEEKYDKKTFEVTDLVSSSPFGEEMVVGFKMDAKADDTFYAKYHADGSIEDSFWLLAASAGCESLIKTGLKARAITGFEVTATSDYSRNEAMQKGTVSSLQLLKMAWPINLVTITFDDETEYSKSLPAVKEYFKTKGYKGTVHCKSPSSFSSVVYC